MNNAPRGRRNRASEDDDIVSPGVEVSREHVANLPVATRNDNTKRRCHEVILSAGNNRIVSARDEEATEQHS
jgi:hypothetical protein